mgnify:CR=1 FL=1
MSTQIPYPKIEMSLSQDMLRIQVNHRGSEFVREIQVKIIEIDGKLYFQPVGSNRLYDVSKAKVIGSIKPMVRYIKLESGVYVPVDYVSNDVMEKLRELDEEYREVREEFNKVCKGDPTKCKSFKDFEKYYLRQFVVTGKQAKIVVDELKRKGFVFRVKKKDNGKTYTIYVKGADGEVDGKWRPLWDTAEAYVRYGGGIYDRDVFVTKIDEELVSWYDRLPESPIFVDTEKISEDGTFESYIRLDTWYDVKVFPLSPIPKDKIVHDHYYRFEYIIVGELNGEKIGVALDYSISHPTTTERDLYHVIKEIRGKKYEILIGTKREVCEKCGLIVEERPIMKTLGRTYVYEIDGELYYKSNDEYSGEVAKIDKWTTLVGNIKPDARYKELDGVYLPLDYLTPEEIEKFERLDKVLKKKGYNEDKRAKIITRKLVAILEKKGFKIEMTDEYVEIEAPDGKDGFYNKHEDWDYEYIEGRYYATTWYATMINGELSLTAMSIYDYY